MNPMSHSLVHRRLLDSFPPPTFLNIAAAGVDISDSSVKVLRFKRTQRGNIPEFFEEYKIEPGLVRKGSIENSAALSETLASLREKYDLSFVRASLPEEKAYLFQTKISHTSGAEQMRHEVEFQLEEHVPIAPGDAIFDYDIIDERPDAIEISVTVFPKEVIANYQKVFKGAGLIPVSFELEGQAIANAVVSPEDTKTYMIVDFGRTRSGISIVKNGIVSFTSTVEVGGNELTDAIKKHFNVDDMKAQEIKNKQGFINSEENKQLHDSLMNTLSALKDEINRHFLYWNTKDTNTQPEDKIHKILLCGGNASLAGLPEFLAVGIRTSVERADVWQNAFSHDDYIPPLNYESALSYATTIGLALL